MTSLQNIDVIILEDDLDIRTLVETILTHNKLSVEGFSNERDFYEGMEQLKPKLILMDMLLSGADGRDICKKLKSDSTTKNISIVMMSAHPDASVTTIAAGADDFLEKPFDLDTLIAKVNFYLQKVTTNTAV